MITHRNITYALRLAEIGNYRRTAAALHITHSALVRGIKGLEAFLEVRLFDRGGAARVTPTAEGEVFLARAREIVLAEADLIQEMYARQGLEKGVLRVAMGSFPSKICGHTAMGRFSRQYPNIQIKITVREYTEVADNILNRESDLGITELSEFIENDELRLEPLGQHRGVFLCRPGHPLLDQSVVTSDTLLDYPCCCTRMPSRFRAALPGDLRRAGSYDPITRELVPAIEINNISGVAPIIAGSDAICPTALLMFRSEIETGKLSVVPFFEPWMVTNYGFVYLKHRNLPFSVEAYMKIVRDVESLLFNEEKSFAETIRQQ